VKLLKVGQKFTNIYNDILEIIDLTRYRVYWRATIVGTSNLKVYGLPITYAEGMTTKGMMRDLLLLFDEVKK